MKAEVLNAFYLASANSMGKELQSPVKRTGLYMDSSDHVRDEVTVYLSLVGQVRGMILVATSVNTARAMASTMLGETQEELTEMGLSALAELGNLVAGGACTELERVGLPADITPPTIMIGARSRISTLGMPRYVIPLATRQGTINLHIAIDAVA